MKTAVKIRELVKNYGGVNAVNHLNIEVPEGSIYGFLGPNGAGKTTTLKMIVGLTEPTSGEIEILGHPVSFGSDAHREEIGFLPDVPGFYDWMSAKEYLEFVGSLYHLPKEELDIKIKELLDLVGLTKSKNKKVGAFSRGMKQRLGIAQALVNSPKIIFLDEPVSALDPIGRKEVMDIIGRLAGKITVLFSSHILADVERVCDQVVIINEGKMILQDSMEHIRQIAKSRNIEIEFENDDVDTFVQALNQEKSIESIDKMMKRVIIKSNDLNKSRKAINKVLSARDILLKKLLIQEATLEDIFIQAVNGND